MNDYISRETVLSKCQQIWSNADETTEIGVAIINIVDELADFVENIPSADIQPVKHGQFKEYSEKEKYEVYKKYHIDFDGVCSECGSNMFESDTFCAECGAKMDEEE